jgi:hypothetical protein
MKYLPISDTSNNKEYVCGKRGGIERFKRELHSSHLSVCGMFGYVQNDMPANWVDKINAQKIVIKQSFDMALFYSTIQINIDRIEYIT